MHIRLDNTDGSSRVINLLQYKIQYKINTYNMTQCKVKMDGLFTKASLKPFLKEIMYSKHPLERNSVEGIPFTGKVKIMH